MKSDRYMTLAIDVNKLLRQEDFDGAADLLEAACETLPANEHIEQTINALDARKDEVIPPKRPAAISLGADGQWNRTPIRPAGRPKQIRPMPLITDANRTPLPEQPGWYWFSGAIHDRWLDRDVMTQRALINREDDGTVRVNGSVYTDPVSGTFERVPDDERPAMCPRGCGAARFEDKHPCPYDVEIHQDMSRCGCCEDCTARCFSEI